MRLPSSVAAVSLTVVLCLGTSAGPALAGDHLSATPTTSAEPTTTPTEPTTAPTTTAPMTTTSAEPITTEPTTTTSAPAQTETITSTPAPPSEPVAAVELADLRLRVWFEKPSYQVTEEITAHASVTNTGTATANQVDVNSTGNFTTDTWHPIFPDGVPVAPGETVERTLTGFLSTDENAVRLVVTVSQRGGEPDANPEDNTVSVSVPVVIVRGDLRGTVFGDRNGNRTRDPGEEFAEVIVNIRGGAPLFIHRWAITGADGTFLFSDLPVGRYSSEAFTDSRGWYVPEVVFEVKGPDDPDVLIRAIPDPTNHLTVSLAFSQQSYQVNDRATAVLTMTNTSTRLLSDLVARCSLLNLDPGQADAGQLAPGGDGVVLPAGTTRQYPITVPITERALMIGHVRLQCAVGVHPDPDDPAARTTAVARVPGLVAPKLTGTLLQFLRKPKLEPPVGSPLPGVNVYLRDSAGGTVVATDVTDADGGFAFCDLPAGLYSLGVAGPWAQLGGDRDFVVPAGENGSPTHSLWVVPSPEQPDPGGPPSGCDGSPPAAAPPGGGAPELAATGPGIIRLALSGLLTLLVGTGLVLIARRGPNGPGSRRS